ncbi:MAG: hypothetical protein WC421_07555 [Elusimicrobiales bacterium]
MKTIAPESLDAFNSPKPKYFKRVLLYRRSWTGAAFVYDDAIDLTPDVAEVGKIQIKLDTEEYNKWTYGNCAVTVRNDRGQWLEGNPDGYFPDGYYVFNSKIALIAGVVRSDGTPDPQYIYTGYLTDDNTEYPEQKTMQLNLLGRMSVFAQFSAALVGTAVTNELIGSNSGLDFSTGHNAAGIIAEVRKGLTSAGPENATVLMADKDYSVANLNEHDAPAAITVKIALNAGQSLWCSYTYWRLDKKIEWIVAQICALCGVDGADISPALFANSVETTFSQLDEAGFSSGEYSNTLWDSYDMGIRLYWNTSGHYPSLTGSYTSPVIDGTADLANWGKLTASHFELGTAVSAFYYRDSADGANWNGWTAIAPGSVIPSLLRYIQLRWVVTVTNDYAWQNYALLKGWQVDYYTSAVTIPVVNMTGLTCEDALAALARMCSYEIGFTGDDGFVFRPRADSMSPVYTLDNSNVAALESVASGAARVYNRVNVTFGGYNIVVDSKTQSEPRPDNIDQMGVREYAISSGNFLPAANVDLARAIAPTVYDYVKGQRRRALARTRFFLHLELGDKVLLKIIPRDFITAWKWGDGAVRYGQTNRVVYYNESWLAVRLPFYNANFRVEGIELDVENWATAFNLTEAL